MCGRYGFTVEDEEAFIERFELEKFEFDLRENWNVAPTQEMPVIERHSPNSLHLRKWGIQASWAPMLMINSKVEKLVESRVWKKAFAESRIIVPATYFIEWQKTDDGKQPYIIRLKSKKVYGFAGLLVTGRDSKGEEQTGYTIITQAAGKFMSEIHHRQPAILRKEDEEIWLNPDINEPEKLIPLLEQFSYENDMEKYPVSSLVNKVSNNFSEIIDPIK